MTKTRSVVAVVVVGVALLASAVTANPSAAAITATVSPSTDLTDGQAVTITADGFGPNVSVGTAECSAAATTSHGSDDCDLTTSKTGNADASGHASFALRVRRTIATPNGTVDCATAAQPCLVAIANLADYTNASGAQITFDADAPPAAPPKVTVAPNTDLPDNQPVYVTAKGFVEGEWVTVTQCPVDDIDCQPAGPIPTVSAPADAAGHIATVLTVRRLIAEPGEVDDCADEPGDCVIVVRTPGLAPGTAPLAFDPSIALPPPPTLTVTPSDALADRQTITVKGAGFTPMANLAIAECVPMDGTYPLCSNGSYQPVNADGNGTFSGTIVVHRRISTYPGDPNQTVVDCATNAVPCEILVTNYLQPTEQVAQPIAFDPSLPLPPPPTAVVTPSDALADRQLVAVTGSGFSPDADVTIAECAGGPPVFSNCSYSTERDVKADANGDVSTTVRVHRTFDVYDGSETPTTLDCASGPDPCEIVVGNSSEFLEIARVAIAFDTDAPAVPAPTATVTPSTNLVDGQTVTLDGDGFAPGVQAFVIQCGPGGADAPHCDTTRFEVAQADDSGHVNATTTVRRVITVDTVSIQPGAPAAPAGELQQSGTTIDCASAAGACTLAVGELSEDANAAIVPLTFDPNGPGGPTDPDQHNDNGAVTNPTTPVPTDDQGTTNDQGITGDPGEVQSSGLARTGASHTGDLTLTAIALVLAGVALTVATRSRRRDVRSIEPSSV